MKLWQKYLFFKLLKNSLFFLIAIYFFYILADLSIHGSRYLGNAATSYLNIVIYYGHHFVKRIAFLIPLSLSLAMIVTLGQMNKHKEILSFQAAGISRCQLFKPPLFLSLLFSLFLLISYQWLSPHSMQAIEQFRSEKLAKGEKSQILHPIILHDGSKIFAANHSPDFSSFEEVFWILSSDEIWHMQNLTLQQGSAKAKYLHRFLRNQKGSFVSKHFDKEYDFLLPPIAIKESKNPSFEKSLTQLKKALKEKRFSSYRKKLILKSMLYNKLSFSILPLLSSFLLFPFLLRYTRVLNLFVITSATLFYLFFYYIASDALILLAEHQKIPLILATLLLPLSTFLIGGYKWRKNH